MAFSVLAKNNLCLQKTRVGQKPILSSGEKSYSFSFQNKKKNRCSKSLVIRSSAEETQLQAVDEEPNTIDVVAQVRKEKILVLGGNGFVGSAICKEALSQGIEVVSLNRSGAPKSSESWVDEVTWIKGDVFDTEWESILSDISSVVSSIGGFGTNDVMEKINGDATIAAINGASKSGVKKFVFISVHDYNLPSFALDNGYFNGKRRAEAQLLAKFPSSGVILRPGFIYGKRLVNNKYEIPLDLVGKPLESILKATESLTKPLKGIPASDLVLASPVSDTEVAKAAVAALTDASLVGTKTIDDIKEIAKQLGS